MFFEKNGLFFQNIPQKVVVSALAVGRDLRGDLLARFSVICRQKDGDIVQSVRKLCRTRSVSRFQTKQQLAQRAGENFIGTTSV